jgi:hypothetical protein
MLNPSLNEIARQLEESIGKKTMCRLGLESGLVKRQRCLTAQRLVPSLIKAMGSKKLESLADLLRAFNADYHMHIHYKPFYNRMDCQDFPKLMASVFESMLKHLYQQVLVPLQSSPFQQFDDIIAHDGSSFAVHDSLQEVFPGRFTKHSPAAVELHCSMSIFTDNVVSVSLSSDSACERHFLPNPMALKGALLLADRGYDSTGYMQQVADAGGSFLIRIRNNHNPIVKRIDGVNKKISKKLEGKKLRDVLKFTKLKGVLDMDVECSGKSQDALPWRLIVRYNPHTKSWMRLLCNLSREFFRAEAILDAYRLRWQIELLFKEFKSYANLHQFQTSKKTIAEGLIWASLCAAFLKRYLAHATQRFSPEGTAISTRRVAMCADSILSMLFRSLDKTATQLKRVLKEIFRFLTHNAKRSNLCRETLKGRLKTGLFPVLGSA